MKVYQAWVEVSAETMQCLLSLWSYVVGVLTKETYAFRVSCIFILFLFFAPVQCARWHRFWSMPCTWVFHEARVQIKTYLLTHCGCRIGELLFSFSEQRWTASVGKTQLDETSNLFEPLKMVSKYGRHSTGLFHFRFFRVCRSGKALLEPACTSVLQSALRVLCFNVKSLAAADADPTPHVSGWPSAARQDLF